MCFDEQYEYRFYIYIDNSGGRYKLALCRLHEFRSRGVSRSTGTKD